MKEVSLVRCDDYKRDDVCLAVSKAIDLIGGIGRFTSPGRKVFLKFNMLMGADPDKCVTTDPNVVYAVAKILRDQGCVVVMGDSPGSGLSYTEDVLRRAYSVSGYDKVSEELGVPLNYDTGYERVEAPDGSPVKQFNIIVPAIWADDIVVVSKAKTHAFTLLSGAAKNLFGIVPGLDKPTYHANFKDVDDFGRMILCLNGLFQPKLQIMDAIMAMEGNGPNGGTPCKIGAILASHDENAIDVVTARLMSFDPLDVATVRAAVGLGYLRNDLSDVKCIGDDMECLVVKDFKPPMTHDKEGVAIFLSTIRPKVLSDICVGCMKCLRSCPVKAISSQRGIPVIDHSICIRCYCCHEMCDHNAMDLERIGNGPVWRNRD